MTPRADRTPEDADWIEAVTQRRISRRQGLRYAGMAAGTWSLASILAACGAIDASTEASPTSGATPGAVATSGYAAPSNLPHWPLPSGKAWNEEFGELEPDIPFTAEEYAGRLDRLRTAMADAKIDLLLLSSAEAMCWLHGFRSRWYKTSSTTKWPPLTFTAVHVDHDSFLNFDHTGHETLWRQSSVAKDIHWLGWADLDSNLRTIADVLRRKGWLHATIGRERWSPTPNQAVAMALEQQLTSHGCKVVDASKLVRGVRRIKSPQEIAMIERAAKICDIGHERLEEVLAPGVTELEALGEYLAAVTKAGGENAAMQELVSGPQASGHEWATTRAFEPNTPVYADPSGSVYRYHANICRTYWLGEPPPGLMKLGAAAGGVYDVIANVAKAGTPVRVVNRTLRDYYKQAGVWDYLDEWVGGYELGIAFPPDWVGEFTFTVWGESPDAVIEDGMVTNFESMVYGVCMIDTIVYGNDGARSLSSLPHQVSVLN